MLDLRGTPLVYDAAKQELVCKDVRAPLRPQNGRVRLRVLLDRGSIEVFGNDGRVAMSVARFPEHGIDRSALSSREARPIERSLAGRSTSSLGVGSR